MTEAAKEARREYRRQWYAANKDKAKAQQERYWTRRAARATETEQLPGQIEMTPAK